MGLLAAQRQNDKGLSGLLQVSSAVYKQTSRTRLGNLQKFLRFSVKKDNSPTLPIWDRRKNRYE